MTIAPKLAAAEASPEPEDEAAPGEIEVEVRAFVADLNFADDDPRRILGRIAIKLARRVDATDASPAAIRELRVLLAQISEVPDQGAGPLDTTRAHRATRRIGALINQAS